MAMYSPRDIGGNSRVSFSNAASPTRHAGPGPIRRRPIERACSQCHKQKQKCNKESPCSNCTRRGIPQLCVWPTREERQRARKPRLSKSRPAQRHVSEASTLPTVPLSTQTDLEPPLSTIEPMVRLGDQPQHHRLGRLWKARGAPSYHGDSYFGHQAAAVMMEAATPDLPTGIQASRSRRSGTAQPFRNERGPYSQLWELVGTLPRQKTVVDRLINRFFRDLNSAYDAVHEETFRIHYEKFYDRRCGFDDLTTIDLRWMSLLFIILAFGELLECPQPCSPEAQRNTENCSLDFYWASRRSLVIAPSFYGESTDLVRAGILITRYLIHVRRISESWLTISFAVRMAQAQGMHVDGEKWGLPRKVVETRRRLWSYLYTLDRSVALALGRPYAINDRHCITNNAGNIWVDNLTNEEARIAQPRDLLTDPTPSALSLYHYQLGVVIGQIQEECFGLSPGSYDEVLRQDQELLSWKDKLPPYFRLEDPDLSYDVTRPYLQWHRLYLHTSYHFARITLHRSYLLRPSITDRFGYSRTACISSACADLKMKLAFRDPSMADRLQFSVAAHQLFNSALILGVIAVCDPHSRQTEAILDDLQAYCDKQNSDPWVNEFGLAEIRVVELCIARARHERREAWQGDGGNNDAAHSASYNPTAQFQQSTPDIYSSSAASDMYVNTPDMADMDEFGQGPPPEESWSDLWMRPPYYFPEPLDYHTWEGLVEDLASGR